MSLLAWLLGAETCDCTSKEHRNGLFETDLEIKGHSGIPSLRAAFRDADLEDTSESTGCRVNGRLPPGPRLRQAKTFSASEAEDLKGDPVFSGNLMQINLEENVQLMQVDLHVNGFSITPIDAGAGMRHSYKRVSRAWSPFTLVEKCQVKTLQHSAYWAVFKLTVFRAGGHDQCLYFAATGGNAYKERDRWVEEMGKLVGQVTLSLFPVTPIRVAPLPGVASTTTRIMAGHLLQGCAGDKCQVVYAELHAYSGGEAKLALYHDEWCDREVGFIPLTDTSTVSTRSGTHCTVFGIDDHRFCARNGDEKDLWLRAVSNIKVKLMFEAPDPTDEELAIFRCSVDERIRELQRAGSTPTAELVSGKAVVDALLSEVNVLPPITPQGDSCDSPIDEAVACSPSSVHSSPERGFAGSGDIAAGPAASRLSRHKKPTVNLSDSSQYPGVRETLSEVSEAVASSAQPSQEVRGLHTEVSEELPQAIIREPKLPSSSFPITGPTNCNDSEFSPDESPIASRLPAARMTSLQKDEDHPRPITTITRKAEMVRGLRSEPSMGERAPTEAGQVLDCLALLTDPDPCAAHHRHAGSRPGVAV